MAPLEYIIGAYEPVYATVLRETGKKLGIHVTVKENPRAVEEGLVTSIKVSIPFEQRGGAEALLAQADNDYLFQTGGRSLGRS